MNRPDPIACGGFRWHSAAAEWEFRCVAFFRAYSHDPEAGHAVCVDLAVCRHHFPTVNLWSICAALVALTEADCAITPEGIRRLRFV